jgi:hypothetical protein
MIHRAEARPGATVEVVDGELLLLNLSLAAGNQLNLNPTVVITAFSAHCGVVFSPVRGTKVVLYDAEGKEFQKYLHFAGLCVKLFKLQ